MLQEITRTFLEEEREVSVEEEEKGECTRQNKMKLSDDEDSCSGEQILSLAINENVEVESETADLSFISDMGEVDSKL